MKVIDGLFFKDSTGEVAVMWFGRDDLFDEPTAQQILMHTKMPFIFVSGICTNSPDIFIYKTPKNGCWLGMSKVEALIKKARENSAQKDNK